MRSAGGARLGGELARRFADELGTFRARRVGLAAFAALALAGVVFAVAYLTLQGTALTSAAKLSTTPSATLPRW